MTDNSSVQVRSAIRSDFNVVAGFMQELESMDFNMRDLEAVFSANLLNNNNIYLVAEHSGGIVGFAGCHLQLLLHHGGWVGEIQELFVAKEWRSVGVGKMLLGHLKTHAIQKGALQLEVTANVAREDSHRFYEQSGFVHTHKKFTALLSAENER